MHKFRERIARAIFRVQGKKKDGVPLSCHEKVLWPLMVAAGFVYYCLNFLKWALYRRRILKPYSAGIFILSVGNIRVGGTGKSPLVIRLATRFLNSGTPAAVVNRGYLGPVSGLNVVSDGVRLLKGVEETSDEAFMEALALAGGKGPEAKRLVNEAIVGSSGRFVSFGENMVTSEKGAAVLTSKQRVDSVKYLESSGFDGICLLDDAFQYYRLERDFDVVVVDYGDPFSNGLAFPAGALRDRPERLAEARAIILSRCPSAKRGDARSAAIERACRKKGFKGSFYRSAIELTGLYSLSEGRSAGFTELSGGRAFLVSAIGDNAGLFRSARKMGAANGFEIFCEGFVDHSDYPIEAQREIRRKMKALGADALITTFKDAVKLRRDAFEGVKVYALSFELLIDGEEELLREIRSAYEAFKARINFFRKGGDYGGGF